MWQQPPGKEPGPASVTRILRDRAPRPGSGGALRLGRGTWACDQRGGPGARNAPCRRGLQSPCPPSPQQWFSPRGSQATRRQAGPGRFHWPDGGGRSGERGLVAMATGRSPRAGLGAERPPESPDAHIRAQEGVGPALSRGPEPGAGSPGICQVPGRARAPGRLVSTGPGRRPRGPHGRLARPHPAARAASCQARPGPARPSPAGPHLPAGLGRTSPLARRGAEGAGQGLEAPPAPGRAGTAASSLGRGAVPFCQEVWGPSPQTPLGAGVPPL